MADRKGWDMSGWFRFGKLPVRVHKLDRLRKASVAAAESEARFFSKKARRFINASSDPDAAMQLVNDALGSTRNWTDPAVAKQLDQQRKAANNQARGRFMSAFSQVNTLRASGLDDAAQRLQEQLVSQLHADLAANRAAMEARLVAHRQLVYRQTKNRQTRAHREIMLANPEFHKELVRFRREITKLGKEIAADPTSSPTCAP